MKNVKLRLFVSALTIAMAIPTGVYAQGNVVKEDCKTQNIECSEANMKTMDKDAKKDCIKMHNEEKKADKAEKQADKAEMKEAFEAKKEAINEFKDANKILNTTIYANEEAMNVELERIEESKLTLTPELQATVDEILLIMVNDDKDTSAEVPAEEVPVAEVPATEVPAVEVPVAEVPATEVPAVEVPATEVPVAEVPVVEEPAVEVPAEEVPVAEVPAVEEPTTEVPVAEVPATEVPVVEEPAVEVPVVEEPTAEVKESHKEKMQARLDNVLLAFTNKNTELTALSTKIIDLVDALKLVK